MEVEFGSSSGVRFLNPENIIMYDSDGNVVFCKCGKPAGSSAMGKEAFIAWCNDCSPLEKYEAEFVYRPPKEK